VFFRKKGEVAYIFAKKRGESGRNRGKGKGDGVDGEKGGKRPFGIYIGKWEGGKKNMAKREGKSSRDGRKRREVVALSRGKGGGRNMTPLVSEGVGEEASFRRDKTC